MPGTHRRSNELGTQINDLQPKLSFFYLGGIGGRHDRVLCANEFPFRSRRSMAKALALGEAQLKGGRYNPDRLSRATVNAVAGYFAFDPKWPEWTSGSASAFAKRYNAENGFNRSLSRDGSDQSILKKIAGIEQFALGATFHVLNEQLAISPSGQETDEIISRSPIVQALHGEVYRKAQGFMPVARRLDNQFGWGGIETALERFSTYIQCDISQVAKQIGEVWSSVVELGSFLELDQQLRASPNASVTPLDPEVRRQFLDLVRTASPFVRQFPSARELDEESGAFFARRRYLESADQVITEAANVDLLSPKDRKLLHALIAAAERGEFQGSKADSRVCSSAKNLVIVGAGIVASFYMGSAASYHSGISPIAKKAGEAIVTAEKPILKLFEEAPGDLRVALEALIKRLKSDRDRQPREMPQSSKALLAPTPPRSKRE